MLRLASDCPKKVWPKIIIGIGQVVIGIGWSVGRSGDRWMVVSPDRWTVRPSFIFLDVSKTY